MKALYEFAIFLDDKVNSDGDVIDQARLLVPRTTVLASDTAQAQLLAARAIPDDAMKHLDRLIVAVAPFLSEDEFDEDEFDVDSLSLPRQNIALGVRGATGITGPKGTVGATGHSWNHWTSAIPDNAVVTDSGYRMVVSNNSTPAIYASASSVLSNSSD